MFDTINVGMKIAELRKINNMTQFDLADKLGISFQAVSNWERGNSMPDISKLPEIAELFGVSIDEILGRSNSVLNEIAKGEKVILANHCESDIQEAAVLMKPQQIKEIIDLSESNAKVISAFLPFLDNAYIEELMAKCEENRNGIGLFLPYLREEKIEELTSRAIEKGDSVLLYLPFMREERVKELAFDAFDRGGLKEASPYFPFMNEQDLIALARKASAQD